MQVWLYKATDTKMKAQIGDIKDDSSKYFVYF